MKKLLPPLFVFSMLLLYLAPTPALAHEQYVLTKQQLTQDLADQSLNGLTSLTNPENITIMILVSLGILVIMVTYFFFQNSRLGIAFDKRISKLESLGHLILRIAFGASLIASAYFHSFLGPEIPVTSLPLGEILIPLMYLFGFLLLLGLLTRIAATGALLILVAANFVYGEYMLTYLNYYGEIIALMIFGSYFLAVDTKLFKTARFVTKYKDLEFLLIRVTYGISVLYPAVTIKLLHPRVITDIVNRYHLTQFHWLFPPDPLFISLGSGLSQLFVGLLIIIGFQTRLASLVTFMLYTMSILYFKEAVWPHYVLLALAGYLVINNGGKLTVDAFIQTMMHKKKR